MKPRHQVSRTAIELIKRFEGYRRKAAQLPDGRWTIGYGHTLTARQGAEVSEEDAEALLLYDLIAVAHVVNETTFAPLTQNQFDALCAFAFNVGLDSFRRSGVLKRVNEGAFIQAAFDLEDWRKAEFQGERIVVDGLVRRRAAEKLLFLTPAGEGFTPTPSPLLKPVLDLDGRERAPQRPVTEVRPSMEGEQVTAELEGGATGAEPALQDDDSPLRAAAEDVTARLQTIFPDTGESSPEREPQPDAPDAPADLTSSDLEMPEPVDPSAEPIGDAAPAEILAEEPSSQPGDVEATGDALAETPIEATEEAGQASIAAEPVEPAPVVDRIVIDDTAPFDFVPAQVRTLEEPKDGLFGLILLAVLGLAFFAGGIFWALNARPGVATGPLTPLTVGWLAGMAGVGFFVAAVFLLLQKLGRSAERRRTDNPRI